jgi:hypothetical protein
MHRKNCNQVFCKTIQIEKKNRYTSKHYCEETLPQTNNIFFLFMYSLNGFGCHIIGIEFDFFSELTYLYGE